MKTENKYWLQDKGTREGGKLIYKREWVPSHSTDIRETFRNLAINRSVERWETTQKLDEAFKD